MDTRNEVVLMFFLTDVTSWVAAVMVAGTQSAQGSHEVGGAANTVFVTVAVAVVAGAYTVCVTVVASA